eukprot:gene5736-4097_t
MSHSFRRTCALHYDCLSYRNKFNNNNNNKYFKEQMIDFTSTTRYLTISIRILRSILFIFIRVQKIVTRASKQQQKKIVSLNNIINKAKGGTRTTTNTVGMLLFFIYIPLTSILRKAMVIMDNGVLNHSQVSRPIFQNIYIYICQPKGNKIKQQTNKQINKKELMKNPQMRCVRMDPNEYIKKEYSKISARSELTDNNNNSSNNNIIIIPSFSVAYGIP